MDKQNELKSIAEELLSLSGVSASVEVIGLEENTYEVNISTEGETGLLIGYRGENINALQTVLSLIFRNRNGDWARIAVNIGDYRQKQEEKLKTLADQAITHALESKEPQPIYNLTPAQRRIIHLYISQRDDVESESLGEDENRYLVVKSK
jgi:spoIIIJ-associated protein